MALTEENGGSSMVMPIAPMYGGNNGGFGDFGGNGAWWLLLFLFAMNGGWGFGGWGGNAAMDGGIGMYPWMNQSNQINNGFRDQMINGTINGIQQSITSGFGDINNALCAGFAGVANGFSQAEIAANARQMTDMQQNFNNQMAVANLQSVVQAENCADRTAFSDGIRDVLVANTANTQTLLNAVKGLSDQMCQDKIDAKNERIADLQNQLTMAQLAASQNAQTAAIQAGQRNLASEIEQYVLPTPRPAYVVSNPNCCQQNYGYGCGCGVA